MESNGSLLLNFQRCAPRPSSPKPHHYSATSGRKQSPAGTGGRMVIGGVISGGPLDPPFSRHTVDQNKVVDGGRYGKWSIGHGQMSGHWDRSTPDSTRPNTSSEHPNPHHALSQTSLQTMQKILPGGVPSETTFHRIMARDEGPKLSPDIGVRSKLICTSSGIVYR